MTTLASKFRGYAWIAAVAGVSLALLAFFAYVLVLDREVRLRFAGARWALPAQVYAAPLEIYPGLALGQKAFQGELGRLGYRPARKLAGPGSFAVGRDRVQVHTRPFSFWDGSQPAARVEVIFASSQVSEISDLAGGQGRTLLRLDPLLIGSLYPTQGEDRVLVKLGEVPALLPAGLIYIEDRHFLNHSGLDPKAILRALWANLRAGRTVQGGSTITQQLVRNFFLTLERKWTRKINEALMALLLELHYSKEDILEAYLNEVHLGQDGGRAIHGFGLGSQFYFNKPLSELQPQEIALLIALVKGPSFYNPRKHPERARERRDLVLSLLTEAGMLKSDEYETAIRKNLGVASDTGGGAAQYPAFVDLVKRQLKGQYPETELTHEGLRVFTTLDPRAQEALEKRVLDGLPRLEKSHGMSPGTLNGAGVVTRVEGGEVLALVGGREVRYPGFNRALDARRPMGSLIKPFVYLAALMQPDRYGLFSTVPDEPIEIKMDSGAVWAPQNYDQQAHGPVPLYLALAKSYNLATVHLGLDIGISNVCEIIRAAGLFEAPPPRPSLLLGAVDMAPLEVAQLYNTLAASGYQAPLLSIREVLTREGQPLTRYPLRIQRTLPEAPVYLLNWALEQTLRIGTGASAYSYVAPEVRLAGKTGTTDDLRDSWFVGYGDDRVVTIWIGRDDNQPAGLTGASGALQIWAPLVRNLEVKSFNPVVPPEIEPVLINPEDGLRADRACAGAVEVPYMTGHAPESYSPCAGWHSPFRWFRRH
ncbi:MAG: penicillin-binding protein 1B [Nevskiales bacterium]|nr:penicillin-binding protein 1B [Nevskiales bacterium]